MIIDITTHKADGSIKIFKKLSSLDIPYVESPVMGGPVQAEEGVLGQQLVVKRRILNLQKKF